MIMGKCEGKLFASIPIIDRWRMIGMRLIASDADRQRQIRLI
jgi:hypothetical protein